MDILNLLTNIFICSYLENNYFSINFLYLNLIYTLFTILHGNSLTSKILLYYLFSLSRKNLNIKNLY